ncbi:MAG: sensor histidine kinase [Thermodesulfobacteriota bacterium]
MKEPDIIGETGLRFFGKVSASISHEIKNTLAVINENAGLLEDLTLMAEKGMELDPTRVRGLAEKILAQVQRSDGIVKNLNRFAHSIDKTGKRVDVEETVHFTALLAARLAAGREVTFTTVSPEKPIHLLTSPFFLKALIFRCLEIAMSAPDADKTIYLKPETTDAKIQIRLTGMDLKEAWNEGGFPTEEDRALLALLEADIEVNSTKGEIVLILSPMEKRSSLSGSPAPAFSENS